VATDQRQRRGRVLRALGLAVLLLVVLATIGAMGLQLSRSSSRVEDLLGSVRPWLWAAQLGCTAVLWLRWKRIVEWLLRTRRISAPASGPLLRARHRLMAAVLLVQLMVGMGLPFSLFDAPTGR